MLAWIFLILSLTSEFGALFYWLRRQSYPIMFNSWAPLLYSFMFAVDAVAAWFVADILNMESKGGIAVLAILGVSVAVLVLLGTLFFRWVIRLDMTDIPKDEK